MKESMIYDKNGMPKTIVEEYGVSGKVFGDVYYYRNSTPGVKKMFKNRKLKSRIFAPVTGYYIVICSSKRKNINVNCDDKTLSQYYSFMADYFYRKELTEKSEKYQDYKILPDNPIACSENTISTLPSIEKKTEVKQNNVTKRIKKISLIMIGFITIFILLLLLFDNVILPILIYILVFLAFIRL